VRRQSAAALLARPDRVEERIVDPDRHPDQDDDDLDAVVEGERLADRAEQAERRCDRGQRQHNGNERGDHRAEREQQYEERDRDGEKLGAVQVVVDDPVPRVARRDVARLFDGDARALERPDRVAEARREPILDCADDECLVG
jgi:hypothetical protein